MSEIGLIGKKIGMSREFYKTGQAIPVTVLKFEKARVIQVIEQEKRGYKAVQVGFGSVKTSKISKPLKGYFAKKNTEPKKILREIRIENITEYKEGNEFGIEIFENVKRRGERGPPTKIVSTAPFRALKARHARQHKSEDQRQE